MNRTSRRGVALAVLLVGLTSWATFGLPGFSDRNIAAGNLNPTDTIEVQRIRVTRSAGETVTLSSITVQNTGTARDGEIDKITVMDGGAELGSTTNIAGLGTGVTVNLGGFAMTGTTHELKVLVTVGTAVDGGETVNLRCKVHYVRDGESGSSSWVSDLTGEVLRNGGFDELEDSSPDAAFLNPLDREIVQIAVFTDSDANGSDIAWTQAAAADVIVEVENLGTALPADIDEVNVTISVGGKKYTSGWRNWAPASPMGFQYGWFLEDLNDDGDSADAGEGAALPPTVDDNAAVTLTTRMLIDDQLSVTDRRTIRTETTMFVTERGEGADGDDIDYEQTVGAETTQTIRKQGFERVEEESEALASGTAATGDEVIQIVHAYDDDSNAHNVNPRKVYIRNMGSATGTEIDKIEVKAGARLLLTLTGNELDDFRTGNWHNLDDLAFVVDDDEDQEFKVYYHVGVPVDGHTLRPVVRFEGRENGIDYASDEVTYPDYLGLYEPGFEFVENMTPPEGGVAYSAQRLLAQTIRVEDRDQDADNVTIHPIVVKNLGTASGNPDVTKIEVWRRDTESSSPVKLGETTDLAGLRTGGARIDLTHDNVVTDTAGGASILLDIYLTIAEPEAMTPNRTIQLETRVLHTEKQRSFDKNAVSNQWTLETNHRPVPSFTFEKAAAAAASIGPMADFTYEDTIQFKGTATDADGDAITTWRWNFGDGNTANVQNPTHRYPTGGTFAVRLTVTDARGVTGSVTKTITVEGPPNEPPTIDDLTADPENPAAEQDVEFTATITDPDQPAGTAFTYAWDFGDEATSTVANPKHSYDEAGTYTVTLTVTDAQGATNTATIDVVVGNEPPTLTGVTATPATAATGEEIGFAAAGYADPDDDAVDRYEWDFKDGTKQNTDAATATHVFAAPGTYDVSVVAVDERGAKSAAKTVSVTITGPARTVLFAFPNPAKTAATFTYLLPDGATDPILRIYNLLGELVLEEELPEGGTTFQWNLRTNGNQQLPTGLYFCMVTATGVDRSEVFRLLLVR